MNISIIVPVLNEYRALKQLIPQFISLADSNQLDLIICDGGSSDLSHAYIRQCQSKCQSKQHPSITFNWISSGLGRAKQMNAGAKQARFEQLIFVHADTQLPFNWPSLIKGKQWGRFNVRLSGHHWMLRIIEKMINWRSCLSQVATGDQAIFVQKSLFEQVGSYPDLALMEDIALSKLLRAQYPIFCVKTPLISSSRRWENQGVFKTIGLMWQLRYAYFRGVNATQLVQHYYPQYQTPKKTVLIQVFSKLPIEGFVKTRLIPKLGARAATNIHRYLLKHSLNVVKQSQMDNELWLAQEKDHTLRNSTEFLSTEFLSTQTLLQQGDNLGDRMGLAIKSGLKRYSNVILIGSDCLDLRPELLSASLQALNHVDIVLTPVADGGFISIACRVFDAQIFDRVAWGTSTALADVIKNLKRLFLSYLLLQAVRDIDTFEDVAEYPELLKLNDKSCFTHY